MSTPTEQSYCLIPLNHGQFAKVSWHRLDELSRWKWHARYSVSTASFYAARKSTENGHKVTVLMHRQILGMHRGDGLQVDHKDCDTLNNQDENLRIASASENQQNQRKRRDNTSGFKGVIYWKTKNTWTYQAMTHGKRIYRTGFASAEEAFAARVAHINSSHGEFARSG